MRPTPVHAYYAQLAAVFDGGRQDLGALVGTHRECVGGAQDRSSDVAIVVGQAGGHVDCDEFLGVGAQLLVQARHRLRELAREGAPSADADDPVDPYARPADGVPFGGPLKGTQGAARQLDDADAGFPGRLQGPRVTVGLEQEGSDDLSPLRHHRTGVEGIPAVVTAADKGDEAGIHVFDVGGRLVDAKAFPQPGDSRRGRQVPQPRLRSAEVTDLVGYFLSDLAHVAVGITFRRGGFHVPTFNVSCLSERQGATVQDQHGVILPHVPALAGQRVRGKRLTNTAARHTPRRRQMFR